MERCRRSHFPFQAFCALPRTLRCRFTLTTHARQDDHDKEVNLSQAKCKRTHRSQSIEVSKLHGVVGITTWHTGQTQEVHGEEGDVERNQSPPEMQFATAFCVHHTRPLGQPVVDAREHGKQRTSHQHIVEVRHNVVTVLQLHIDGCHRQDQACEATHGEHKDEANRKQHGRFKGHRTFPHGCNPVEHLHTGRHRNQHGGVHEEQLTCHRHASGVHVVRPHNERQDGNRSRGVHHRGVTEELLACKSRHHLADDAKGWQDHDVHLRVTKEPEDVLVHDRVTTTCGVEEGGAKVTVSQRHGDRASQHRHHSDQQISSDQPSPNEHGHLHQGHARCAHVQDGHHDVDRTHDGRSTQDVQRENGGVHRRAHLHGQRRIQSPARSGCAARHEE